MQAVELRSARQDLQDYPALTCFNRRTGNVRHCSIRGCLLAKKNVSGQHWLPVSCSLVKDLRANGRNGQCKDQDVHQCKVKSLHGHRILPGEGLVSNHTFLATPWCILDFLQSCCGKKSLRRQQLLALWKGNLTQKFPCAGALQCKDQVCRMVCQTAQDLCLKACLLSWALQGQVWGHFSLGHLHSSKAGLRSDNRFEHATLPCTKSAILRM